MPSLEIYIPEEARNVPGPEPMGNDAEEARAHESGVENKQSPENNGVAEEAEESDFREQQSYGSRLAEYLTGMTPENPYMAKRLLKDQEIIRTKYGLPSRDIAWEDPRQYELFLRNIAKSLNIEVRDTSDCGGYFTQVPAAGAYLNESQSIGVSIDRSDAQKYAVALLILEHETIHALQDEQTPRMPIEIKEYEAYIAGASRRWLENADPEALETLFGWGIGGSVNAYYREESRNRGEPAEPEWNNPNYFRKNVDRAA